MAPNLLLRFIYALSRSIANKEEQCNCHRNRTRHHPKTNSVGRSHSPQAIRHHARTPPGTTPRGHRPQMDNKLLAAPKSTYSTPYSKENGLDTSLGRERGYLISRVPKQIHGSQYHLRRLDNHPHKRGVWVCQEPIDYSPMGLFQKSQCWWHLSRNRLVVNTSHNSCH